MLMCLTNFELTDFNLGFYLTTLFPIHAYQLEGIVAAAFHISSIHYIAE